MVTSEKISPALGWLERHSSRLAILFVIIFMLSGVLTLHAYGMTWDEGLGNFFFGERNFKFFTSFDMVYLDFKADLDDLAQKPLHLYLSPFHNNGHEFPPVADTLAAASMYLFSYGLGWLNPIDGFHLAVVLLSGLFLWRLYNFSAPRLGKFTAWMAILLLACFPRFWADMHFNVKDVPETVFFGLTLMSFWTWHEKPTWGSALGSGLLFGCALGVKANAIFIPIILALAILPKSLRARAWLAFLTQTWRRMGQYILMGLSALALYLLSWPVLYVDLKANLFAYWTYISSQNGRVGQKAFNPDPLLQVVTTMPEWMLILLCLGLALAVINFWKKPASIWTLLLVWFLFPIARISMPRMVNFDGIRHFMEFVPAAALLAGCAASWLLTRLSRQSLTRRLALGAVLIAILALNTAWIASRQYPYLHIYYNTLTGGLAGAQKAGLTGSTIDYWGVSYRQAMEWLDQNTEPQARVYAFPANWIFELSAPVLMRPDIRVLPEPLSDFKQLEAKPKPTYLVFLLAPEPVKDELAYCRAHYQLVHEIVTNSVTILQIYRVKNIP